MRKKFNITGTCFPNEHYMADTSMKLKATLEMVQGGEYFIINRPRQFGKTTMLNTIADTLAKDYIVFNISFEGTGDEFFRNEQNLSKGFLRQLKNLSHLVAPHLLSLLKDLEKEANTMDELSDAITTLVVAAGKKVILQIDEVDKSANNELFISFLGMLRQKYLFRKAIPTFHSVVLAGLHDIKTLKSKIRPESEQKYNSPWNIAADYRVNMNLLIPEIVPMLEEYKQDRGVEMDTQAIAEQLFYYTSGYPFLVSKLCKILDEDVKKYDSWTDVDIELAVKMLVKESNANFDSLTKQLENNQELRDFIYRLLVDNDRVSYNIHNPLISLAMLYGIIAEKEEKVKIHNRIYQEVLANYMASGMEIKQMFTDRDGGYIYKNPNGSLNMESVLLGFQAFMKKEYSKKDRDFLEKHGRLVFLAFIKPIINGKGYDFKEPQISDEKRLDVVITYLEKKYIAELKLWRGEKAHQEGIKQLHDYLDVQGLNEGYLIIFDHSEIKKWQAETIVFEGKTIMMVWV
jgi:AAA-like domain/PD-(D/E)XK nuclease superfamily